MAAAVILPALLILSALIPKEAIRQHSLESAQYLSDREPFGYVIEGLEGSCIDKYADAILLNIAYHFSAEYPFRSVMLSAYYFTPDHEETENYLIAVENDLGVNRQYLRYWHGSITWVRPLLLFLNLQGIYVLNAVLLILLLAFFCIICARLKEYPLVIAFVVAFVMTRAYFVPLSLEYTWTFLLMLILSILAILLYRKKMEDHYTVFFAVAGMITSFVDFLTTETITLLVPLLVILWLGRKDNSSDAFFKRKDVRMSLFSSIAWVLGYVCMWGMKWLMCSVVMQENAMPYVGEHVSERLGGDMGVSLASFLTGAVTRNIACLFPLGYGALGVMGFTIIVLSAVYIGFVYRRDGFDRGGVILLALVGLVPYVRYLVLHNHSYIHYFFTFRAQFATVAAVVLIIAALVSENR